MAKETILCEKCGSNHIVISTYYDENKFVTSKLGWFIRAFKKQDCMVVERLVCEDCGHIFYRNKD